MKKLLMSAVIAFASALSLTCFVSCKNDTSDSDTYEVNYVTLPESVGTNELKGKSFSSSSASLNVRSVSYNEAETYSQSFAFNDEGTQVTVTSEDGSKVWYNYTYDSENNIIYLGAVAAEIENEDGTKEKKSISDIANELKTEIDVIKRQYNSMMDSMISISVQSYEETNPSATKEDIAEVKAMYENLFSSMITNATEALDVQFTSIITIAENITAFTYEYNETAGTITLTHKILSDTDIQSIPYLYDVSFDYEQLGDYSVSFADATLTVTDKNYDTAMYFATFKNNAVTFKQLLASLTEEAGDFDNEITATASFDSLTNIYTITFNDGVLKDKSIEIGITPESVTLTESK